MALAPFGPMQLACGHTWSEDDDWEPVTLFIVVPFLAQGRAVASGSACPACQAAATDAHLSAAEAWRGSRVGLQGQ